MMLARGVTARFDTSTRPLRRIVMASNMASCRRLSTASSAFQEERETTTSNRARFRSLPVHPSILKHIQSIGVGIPDRKEKRQQQRSARASKTHKGGALIDLDKEEEFLRRRGKTTMPSRRGRPASRTGSSPSRASSPSWLPPPPFGLTSGATMENGRKIRRKPVRLVSSVGSLVDSFPENTKGLPEVALAGRSNVGKSTLLNALLYGNQGKNPVNVRRRRGKANEGTKLPKGIKAATSDRPGETKSITFYRLSSEIKYPGHQKDELAMFLVDLPGYGFAYAAEAKSSEWRELMSRYLLDRGKTLKRVLLLVDARHGMKKADTDFLNALETALYSDGNSPRVSLPPIQLVLTKCDLVPQIDLARRVVLAREQLSSCLRRETSALPVMLVSAKAGVGFNNVRDDRARGGILELQKEISAVASWPHKPDIKTIE